MADDMSQGSENSDYEDDEMCEEDNYYDETDDFMETETDKKKEDPEYFEFDLLKVEDVDRLLNESVEALCKSLQVFLYFWKRLLILDCLDFVCVRESKNSTIIEMCEKK